MRELVTYTVDRRQLIYHLKEYMEYQDFMFYTLMVSLSEVLVYCINVSETSTNYVLCPVMMYVNSFRNIVAGF